MKFVMLYNMIGTYAPTFQTVPFITHPLSVTYSRTFISSVSFPESIPSHSSHWAYSPSYFKLIGSWLIKMKILQNLIGIMNISETNFWPILSRNASREIALAKLQSMHVWGHPQDQFWIDLYLRSSHPADYN